VGNGSVPFERLRVALLAAARRRGRTRAARGVFALALGLALLAAEAGPAGAQMQLRASGLHPGFRAGIHNYTVPCAEPTRLFVRTPGATKARIGGGRWFTGTRERRVHLRVGQAVKVTKKTVGSAGTYSIRCLPADFPRFKFTRHQEPRHGFYIMTPGGAVAHYVVVVDQWGVPVWWFEVDPSAAAIDAKVLGRQIVWTRRYGHPAFGTSAKTAYEFRRPDGTLVRSLRAVGTITDIHDLQPTPDGNYLILSYRPRSGVDASAQNGDAEATVYDGVVQKLAPDGRLLWEWSTAGHIGLAETGRWWTRLTEPYDIVHINAVEPLAHGDFLISLRHTDAVYRIDGATGEVEWKLGGTPTEESLTVHDDPFAPYPLGGQHDVRYLGGGEISLHDNETDLGRAPRAVRYSIQGAFASLIDSQSDPQVPVSPCCGSARYSDGSWLISWGGIPRVTEFAPNGRPTFELRFDRQQLGDNETESVFSYRVVGVDSLKIHDFRAGMNAQVSPKRLR
jgi:hypothetical protein